MKIPSGVLKTVSSIGGGIKDAASRTASATGRAAKATGRATRASGRFVGKAGKSTGKVIAKAGKRTGRIGKNLGTIIREDFNNSKLGKKTQQRYKDKALGSTRFKETISGVREKQRIFDKGQVPPDYYKNSPQGITGFRNSWRRQAGSSMRGVLREEINKSAVKDAATVGGAVAAGGAAVALKKRKKK